MLFQPIQFSQIVLIQTIQFSINIVFVHTQLNVKTVLTYCFAVSQLFRGARHGRPSKPESKPRQTLRQVDDIPLAKSATQELLALVQRND